MALKVAWDVSHGEFTIEDGYYFSKLLSALRTRGVEVMVTKKLWEAEPADVLVLNYPEKPFTAGDVDFIEGFLNKGKRVLALAYYNDEDGVSSILNEVSRRFGIEFLPDAIVDEEQAWDGDPYIIVTSQVLGYREGVRRVLMPYSASLRPLKPRVTTVLRGEPSARSTSGNAPILGCEVAVGRGRFLCLGTCVFWDNFAIVHFDNFAFALNILGAKP